MKASVVSVVNLRGLCVVLELPNTGQRQHLRLVRAPTPALGPFNGSIPPVSDVTFSSPSHFVASRFIHIEAPFWPAMASGVDARLLKSTKFPPEFNKKVDMQKVNLQVMKKFVPVLMRISRTY